MKRMVLECAAALALLPLVAAPAAAARPNIYHTITSTHAGATIIIISDDDVCEQTEVYLSSSDAMYAAQPGPVNKQGLTGVLVQVVDTCATPPEEPGEVTPAAAGGILYRAEAQSETRLVADPRLNEASVSDVMTGTDDEENEVTIQLDAVWTGTGPLEHSTPRNINHYPEGNVIATENNLYRAAVAQVSVSVELEGEPVLSVVGTDQNATLQKLKGKCIEVPRPGVTEFYPCFGFPG